MNKLKLLKRGCGRGIALAALASTGLAQSDTASTTPAPASSTEEVVVLDTFEVKDVPNEDQIMPTTRPISSVMGDSRSILDTPRAVSSVNKELMNQVRIKSVTDLQQFSPGVYTASRYGIPTTPGVRGDLAAMYMDGQRVKFSRNSVMPSFNGVEAIDIVKGPGSAVYGPQGADAAGYVNFVTKKPYFDGQHTEVSLSLAGIASDHNYTNLEWSIDNSGPISDKTAYRISYLGREGEGYFQNTDDNTQDVFFALTHLFSDTLRADWWMEVSTQNYDQVSGINHVTQDLIDNSIYVGSGGTIKIDPYQSLVGKYDEMKATRFQTQLTLTKDLTPDTSLKNLTYFETRKSDNYAPSMNYSEYVPTDWTVQNRTEYHAVFDLGKMENSVITGIDMKFERLVAYQSFYGETYSADLTQDSSTWSNAYPVIYQFGVPGHDKYGTDIGYGNYAGNQDSSLTDIGAFYQHDIKLTSKLSAIAGARIDYIYADTQSPEYFERSSNIYRAAGYKYDQSGSVLNPSYYLSSIYKVTPKSSIYLTYDSTYAVQGGGNFGGVGLLDNTKKGLEETLKSEATLLELGYKFVALDNKLYNTFTLFRQERQDPDKYGNAGKRLSEGFEYEGVYQVNKNLNFIGNYTRQDVTRETPAGVKYRYAATPRWMLNGRVNYKFDSGFGFGIGPQITGSQQVARNSPLHLPVQYTINSAIFYTTKKWDIQLNINNITNQTNWSVIDPDYFSSSGGGTLYATTPLSMTLTTRYRF
jgi:iron complex outermembrane recepter protein